MFVDKATPNASCEMASKGVSWLDCSGSKLKSKLPSDAGAVDSVDSLKFVATEPKVKLPLPSVFNTWPF